MLTLLFFKSMHSCSFLKLHKYVCFVDYLVHVLEGEQLALDCVRPNYAIDVMLAYWAYSSVSVQENGNFHD